MISKLPVFCVTNKINGVGHCDSAANFLLTPLRWAAGGKIYDGNNEKVDDYSTSTSKTAKKIVGVTLIVPLFFPICIGLLLKKVAWETDPDTRKRYQDIFDKRIKTRKRYQDIFDKRIKKGSREAFIQGLKRWVQDESIYGYKWLAHQRMVDAYDNNSTNLPLNDLYLPSLPVEIGQLSLLTELYLFNNNLTSLPAEIGQMSSLTWLGLDGNNLTSLPAEIVQLSSLTGLGLSGNNLTSLPAEVGQLSSLTQLGLFNNNLTSLPAEIGQLSSLTKLHLGYNQLTSLPAEIGQLTSLTDLAIENNPELCELPLSLGSVPGLTYISSAGTSLPDGMLDSILNSCKALRTKNCASQLPSRLKLWAGYAGEVSDSLSFILELEERNQASINEWLLRLTKTGDFSRRQQGLARTVCMILKTLKSNENFRENFFIEVEHNNERCEDRAAMTFNLIYTHWKIDSMQEGASLANALKVVAGVAKTIALREALANAITGQNIGESVEIYLYYEQQLKKRLSLETAIESMSHSDIGKREWINEEVLVEKVMANYPATMAELVLNNHTLLSIIQQDSSFREGHKKLNEQFYAKYNLLEKQADLGSGEYQVRSKDIQLDREMALNAYTIKWLESTCKNYLQAAIPAGIFVTESTDKA